MNARVQNDVLLHAADSTAESRYFSPFPAAAAWRAQAVVPLTIAVRQVSPAPNGGILVDLTELAEAAGHRILTEILTELVARSSLIAMLYQSSNDAHCSTDEHEQFLRICETGHADSAVANMMDHLQRLEASLDLGQVRVSRQLDLVNALMM